MRRLPITLACASYDYLQPLRDGTIAPDGIDLRLLTVECGVRHGRMLEEGAYDACEFSMGSLIVASALGKRDLWAVPFFFRRMFVHRFCFVRQGSGIRNLRELSGKRVGILSYQNSLAIHFKGLLMQHGVLPSEVTWVAQGKERVVTSAPVGVSLVRAPAGASLESLLLAGEIDAMVAPDLPRGAAPLNGSFPIPRRRSGSSISARAPFR